MPLQPQRRDGTYYAISVPGKDGQGLQPRSIGFMPVPGTAAPDEYTTLYIDIERTLTVLSILFPQSGGLLHHRARSNEEKFSEYYDKLADIALTGLGQDQPRLGRLALVGLQDEIVSREAARVKNAYIRRLGFWALAFALPAIGFYLICRYTDHGTLLYRFREFVSLIVGCYLGTWLSFVIRRQQLTFWDLARLEEDLLDPPFRLAFVAGLAIVVGLMFSTRMIVFNIGGFNTWFLNSGTLAVLIGAFCGIGELGLSGTVARRASDFVAAIGTGTPTGGVPPTPPRGSGGGGGSATSSGVASGGTSTTVSRNSGGSSSGASATVSGGGGGRGSSSGGSATVAGGSGASAGSGSAAATVSGGGSHQGPFASASAASASAASASAASAGTVSSRGG